MSFFEQRLPERFSFGAKGGPMFSTEVNKTAGGQRYANQNWLLPLHRFDVSHNAKTEDAFQEIRAFFYNVKGMFDAFRFKDWGDYKATSQPLTSIVTGTSYQMTRAYIFGARTFSRPIFKPVSGATVTRNRSGALSSASVSVDTTTGIVTILSGHVGGDVYTWSGEFDIPVAFTSDMLERSIDNRSDGEFVMSWPSIQVEEIRL
jgi:uncharacterized protein (TIGR02217 family)